MNKLLIIIIFTILVSCKNTELSTMSFHLTNEKSHMEVIIPITDKDEEQSTQVEKVQAPKLSCLRYCAGINQFAGIEKDNFAYLAFINFGYRGIGRCRGHALLTQKLNILASFTEGGGCDLNETICLDKYREGINRIKSFEKTTFSGFKNLYEFSLHPKIKSILKGIVAGTSNRYKAPTAYLETSSHGSQILNHYHEIKRRVRLGQMPYVGVLGDLTGAHGLLPYRESSIGSMSIICAKDPNISTGAPEVCESYFYEQDGDVFYKRMDKEADKMLKFSLTGDEDDRMSKYHEVLDNDCITDSKKLDLCK